MNRKQFILLTVLMVVTSFLGGIVASILFNPKNVWAKTTEKTIIAEKFFVIDKAKKVRIALGLLEDGAPGIIIYDKDGNQRAAFGLDDEESPGLVLIDKADNIRSFLSLYKDGSPELRLTDEKGVVIWTAP